jgi:ABC-2 type transport system ATP-binding protein
MVFAALHPEASRIDATLDDLGCGLSWAAVHKARPRAALRCPDCGHGGIPYARGAIIPWHYTGSFRGTTTAARWGPWPDDHGDRAGYLQVMSIEARGLTKRYGDKTAVDDLTFTVRPGMVTGFLGVNGAGKSTTMRLILGLDSPTKGTVTVNGKLFSRLYSPMRELGALLDAKAVHGGRSAYSHLLCLAQTNDIPRNRVDEVLSVVGLSGVARKRSRGFSLGMSQRLGIAAALLGDPEILMFDEPVNGLDPEGIVWIRNLMRGLAADGRTVLVSSHLMSEMEHTADHLIVIGKGKLIADCTMAEFIARSGQQAVRASTPQPGALARAVLAAGGQATITGDVTVGGSPELEVRGLPLERIGDVAFAAGVPLHLLAPARASLEEAFMELTADSVEYQAGMPISGQRAHATATEA